MSTAPNSHLRFETINSVTVAHLLDHNIVGEENVRAIFKELRDEIEPAAVTKLVLDFRDVEFVPSSVLAHLLTLAQKLKERQGTLKLCGLNPVLTEAFRVTRLSQKFEIHADEATALGSF